MFKNKWRLRREAREEEERKQLNFLFIFSERYEAPMKVTLPRLKWLERKDEAA